MPTPMREPKFGEAPYRIGSIVTATAWASQGITIRTIPTAAKRSGPRSRWHYAPIVCLL